MPPITAQNAGTQDGAASAPPPEEDFDAALSALIEDKTAPALSAAESPVEGNDAGAAAEPAPSFDDAATAPAAGDEPPANEPSNDDIWSNADPALREAHQRELRDANLRLAGIQGRQSAADREVHRLRKELAELQAQGGSGASQAPQTEGSDHGTAEIPADKLRQLREDFPEVAGPLLDVIDGLKAQVTEMKAPLGALEQERSANFYAAQQTALEQQHPDWQQVATDDRFAGWVESQPQAIKDALQRNFEAIVDAKEAALVIGLAKAELGIGGPSSTPKPSPQVQQRRERQIAAGRDAGRTGPPVMTGVPDDLDAAISLLAKRYG